MTTTTTSITSNWSSPDFTFGESHDELPTIMIVSSTSQNRTVAIPIAKVILYITGLILLIVGLAGKVEILSPHDSAAAAAPINIVETVETLSTYPPVVDDAEEPVVAASSVLLFDSQWPDIRHILCPAGKPDTTFASTLFAMARTKLRVKRSEFATIKQQNLDVSDSLPTEKLTYQFFHGRFGNATIYISGNHTVAYIPIWKAASDAVRHWMDHRLVKKGTIESTYPESLFDGSRKGRKPTCVVTAIRDPISHFLSGYNEIEFRRDSLAENKIVPMYYKLPFRTEEQRHDRFVQFVRDFALEESKAIIHQPYGHVFSMSRVLEVLGRNGGFLSGYLPSIANLSAEFPSFVKNTCHLDHDLPPMTENMGHHDSSGDPEGFYRAAKTVWSEGGEVARALCILHAMDYACWKNLPDGVPLVCQEVYTSPEFVDAFL